MRLPRVKAPHRPHRLADGRVRLGGTVYKIAVELKDPDGWIWAMLELMDGTRSPDDIAATLADRFPRFGEHELLDGLRQLIGTGYVEDAAEPPPDGLTPREQDRYSRSTQLYQWMNLNPGEPNWLPQQRLRTAAAVVVGVGGTGGAAALALAMSGVGRIHCVEPDVVELSNLNRQVLYTEHDIGRPKVEAAVERLRAHNSDIQLSGERREVLGPDDLVELGEGYDLLVLAGDRPLEIRGWANQAALKLGIPWVYGGYHGPQITAGAFRPGQGPCYECVRLSDRDRHPVVDQDEPVPPSHPANAISAVMSGTLLAHAAMALITGAPKLPVNCVYGMNLVAPDHSFVITAEAPRPDCTHCGAGG
ncbi:ThiF family adenylyltransferase [Nonomuraea sp. SBT364]|uniref:ThiF family adenylyltransferase n=1 Tax=Nonomuraea sp. SBT364 TaxID=1580530 RepID=UPI00066CCB0D|nr:ThiF family adenylyltransferase [Nonomuraea sp. SBT364]